MARIKPSRLLLDTNVWLDYFFCRSESVAVISKLIASSFDGELVLMYAPSSAKDLFYLIPRYLVRLEETGQECSAASRKAVAWACLQKMMELAVAAPQSFAECELARVLKNAHDDFEDNLIVAAAETAEVDYVVTEDEGLRSAMPEVCISPERALELMSIGAGKKQSILERSQRV